MEAIHDWCMAGTNDQSRPWCDIPACALDWFNREKSGEGYRDMARHLMHAYQACFQICQVEKLRTDAENTIQHYQDGVERRKQKETETPAETPEITA
jgi:hypothetical protein